jgi:hypothetical protein
LPPLSCTPQHRQLNWECGAPYRTHHAPHLIPATPHLPTRSHPSKLHTPFSKPDLTSLAPTSHAQRSLLQYTTHYLFSHHSKNIPLRRLPVTRRACTPPPLISPISKLDLTEHLRAPTRYSSSLTSPLTAKSCTHTKQSPSTSAAQPATAIV